jgi:hypothetical protein
MLNFTDDELEVVRIVYNQGLRWGQDLKNLVEARTLDLTKPINLILDLGEIKIENFSKKTSLLMKLGSTKTGIVGNSMFVKADCSPAEIQ